MEFSFVVLTLFRGFSFGARNTRKRLNQSVKHFSVRPEGGEGGILVTIKNYP